MFELKIRSFRSRFCLSQSDRAYIFSRARELAPTFFQTELVFVSEEVLDQVASERIRLDRDCVRSLFSKSEERPPVLAQLLSGCQKKAAERPLSAFVRRREVEDFFEATKERLILISDRRVREESKKFDQVLPPRSQFRFFLACEILHNLARAYLNSETTEAYERVIEESLAEAFAFSRLAETEKESFLFHRRIREKPLECQGWVFFAKSEIVRGPSIFCWLSAWKKREIPEPFCRVHSTEEAFWLQVAAMIALTFLK